MNNYYELLGIAQTATEADIKAAFKSKAKQYHPDINPTPDGEAMFKRINEAYEVLKNQNKRSEYDLSLRVNRNFNHSQPNMNDFYQWQQKMHKQQNKIVFIRYVITLQEAFFGKETELEYSIPSSRVKQTVKLKIPPSVVDGSTFLFQGKGETTYAGVAPGDLRVSIQIMPDANFTRNNYDLYTNATIDYIDAMLGTHKIVPCIDGSEVRFYIMSGIKEGSSIRVPERGMVMPNGKRGDMFVIIKVVQPILSESQIEILKKIKSN